jgi:hypothetical protein
MKRDQPKALFRRGRAYLELKKFDLAKRDLLSCQRIAPSNKDILRTLHALKAAKAAAKAKDKGDWDAPIEETKDWESCIPIAFTTSQVLLPNMAIPSIDIGTLTFSVESPGKAFWKAGDGSDTLVQLTEEEMMARAACKDGWSSTSAPVEMQDSFQLLSFIEFDRPGYISRKDWETPNDYTSYKGVHLGPRCIWSPATHLKFPIACQEAATCTIMCLKILPAVAIQSIVSFACSGFLLDETNAVFLEEASIRNDSMFGSATQEKWRSSNGSFTVQDVTAILTERFRTRTLNSCATGPHKEYVWGMGHLVPSHRRSKYQRFSAWSGDNGTFYAGMHLGMVLVS